MEDLSFKPSLEEGYALGGEEKSKGSKWREAEAEQRWLGSQTHPPSSILKATRAVASNPSQLCPSAPSSLFLLLRTAMITLGPLVKSKGISPSQGPQCD